MVSGDRRDILERERDVALARIQAVTTELEDIVTSSEASNADDEHDPEGSTIAFERAQVGTLLLAAQTYLEDVDQALIRLDTGRYARCEECGDEIGAERLDARPAARTCLQCAGPTHSPRTPASSKPPKALKPPRR